MFVLFENNQNCNGIIGCDTAQTFAKVQFFLLLQRQLLALLVPELSAVITEMFGLRTDRP